MKVVLACMLSLMALVSVCSAQTNQFLKATIPLFSQKLGINVPSNWKIASQQKSSNIFLLEFIPPQEELANWTEMLTVEAFKGMASQQSVQSAYQMEANSVVSSCPKESINYVVENSNTQGYDSISAIVGCSKHPFIKGRNEVAFYTFIKGKADIYMIKKSFRELLEKNTAPLLDKNSYKKLANEVLSVTVCKNDGQGPACIPEAP